MHVRSMMIGMATIHTISIAMKNVARDVADDTGLSILLGGRMRN